MPMLIDIENAKLDIINWIKRTNNEQLIYKLEGLRSEDLNFNTGLTEDQKREIMTAINTLDEDN
jgi:hypothetical protein